jgi:ABC-2 type transport system permease protein
MKTFSMVGSVPRLFLLTIAPGAVLSSALGLTLHTRVKPHLIPLVFAAFTLPITFLGAVCYPWASLAPIRWLQIAALVNPQVSLCEGFRLALTQGVQHGPVWAIYGGMVDFTVVPVWFGVGRFRRRELS